jgi:hypothetical protein
MTKQHFIALAKVLSKHNPAPSLVYDMCDYFATVNPQFDRDRFLQAVYGGGNVAPDPRD